MHGKFLLLYGGNDRLGKRLRILLLYQRLDPRSVHLLRCRIVLFILMEDDCIGGPIFYLVLD